jgi:hypothetical protein
MRYRVDRPAQLFQRKPEARNQKTNRNADRVFTLMRYGVTNSRQPTDIA